VQVSGQAKPSRGSSIAPIAPTRATTATTPGEDRLPPGVASWGGNPRSRPLGFPLDYRCGSPPRLSVASRPYPAPQIEARRRSQDLHRPERLPIRLVVEPSIGSHEHGFAPGLARCALGREQATEQVPIP
jgi:hypothetical protein